jgi:hypothetical protein
MPLNYLTSKTNFNLNFISNNSNYQSTHDNMLLSLLKTNTKITSTHNFTLPKKILDFSRLAHVNEKDAHSSVVNALQFHPTNNLMLSAGLDKK